MRVWVVYALPDRQAVQELDVPESATVAEAVARSGLLQKFPEIAERPLACAIYGRAVADSQGLRADDRVEILRPLQVDPKESRRRAAEVSQDFFAGSGRSIFSTLSAPSKYTMK